MFRYARRTRVRWRFVVLAGFTAVSALLLAGCGDGRYTPATPEEQAKVYGTKLDEGLASSDLTPEQADCVEADILDTWDLLDLARDGLEPQGASYVNYFGDVDNLVFSGMPDSSSGPAGAALYDIVAGCGVDLRTRAIDDVLEEVPSGFSLDEIASRRRCAVSSATPEAMREHWESRLQGVGASPNRSGLRSAYERRVQSGCRRSLEKLLDPSPPSSPPSEYVPEEQPADDDDFCNEQYDLVWEMYRDGQLSEADFVIQRQELEDACIGL